MHQMKGKKEQFPGSFHVETWCDWTDPLWIYDCFQQVCPRAEWLKGVREFSDMFSATGHRDCSFRGTYCSILRSWGWTPLRGGSRWGRSSTKGGIINQVVTWHTARGSLATGILQLSAIRTQAAFNYHSHWRGQWHGESETADNPSRAVNLPSEQVVRAHTVSFSLIVFHPKQK